MTNKDQEIEKIAQEEVYPDRYQGMKFPGIWASDRHHAVCLNVAEDIYKLRAAESRRKASRKQREENKEKKENELD